MENKAKKEWTIVQAGKTPRNSWYSSSLAELKLQSMGVQGDVYIVKEMSDPNVIGGIRYEIEMELVEIRENHVVLKENKLTSSLTGGAAEYFFSIDEIGKTIFPKCTLN